MMSARLGLTEPADAVFWPGVAFESHVDVPGISI